MEGLTFTVDQSSHDVGTRFESKLEWASLEFPIPRVDILSDERRLKLETPETDFVFGNMDFRSFFCVAFSVRRSFLRK